MYGWINREQPSFLRPGALPCFQRKVCTIHSVPLHFCSLPRGGFTGAEEVFLQEPDNTFDPSGNLISRPRPRRQFHGVTALRASTSQVCETSSTFPPATASGRWLGVPVRCG